MDAINTENIEQYFQLLKDTLVQNNLMNAPQQLYTMRMKMEFFWIQKA